MTGKKLPPHPRPAQKGGPYALFLTNEDTGDVVLDLHQLTADIATLLDCLQHAKMVPNKSTIVKCLNTQTTSPDTTSSSPGVQPLLLPSPCSHRTCSRRRIGNPTTTARPAAGPTHKI